MKLFLKLVVFVYLVLNIPFILKHEIKLPSLYAQFPTDQKWEMKPPTDEILSILKEPFDYLGQGNQSTVFISHDKKYVLKIFRYRRTPFKALHWLKNFYKAKPKLPLNEKLRKTFTAAHLACNEGKEFTQGVYCHLNETENSLPKTTLKIGRKSYPISLDKYRFAIQKKAEPFKKTLLAARNNRKKFSQLLDSFGELLVKRAKAQISNSDPNLGPNFGFLENQALEIDFGNYQKATPKKEEISHYLICLESWIEKKIPEHHDLAIELRRKIENAYDEKNEKATKSTDRS